MTEEYILSQEGDDFYLRSKSYFEKKDIIDNNIITKENIQQICNTNDGNKRFEIVNKYIDINTFVDKNKKKVELAFNHYNIINKIIIDCITNFNNCDYEPEDIENAKNLVQQKSLYPIGDYIATIKNLLNSFIRKPKEFKNIWTKQLIERKFEDLYMFMKKSNIDLNLSSESPNVEILIIYEIFNISNILISIFNKIDSEEELRSKGSTDNRSFAEQENEMFDKNIELIKKSNIYTKSISDISYEIYNIIKINYDKKEKEKNKKRMIKYGLIGLGILLILICCSSSIYYMKNKDTDKNTSSSGKRRKKARKQ